MSDKEKTVEIKGFRVNFRKVREIIWKGVVMKLGDKVVEDIESIPTGSVGLDSILGVGGYPRGRVIEIYGPESSGKTTLTIHALEVQKQGGIACL